MYILFEDAGKFLAGRILSEAEASMQVELDSGKRVKVKAAQALVRFDKPAPAELLRAGTELAREIDVSLPAAATVDQLMRAMAAAGRADYDHSGLITMLEDLAAFPVSEAAAAHAGPD